MTNIINPLCEQIVSDKNFYIIDDIKSKPAYIISDNGEFNIINNNEKNITFIAIDSCIYNSDDDTRCDFAIYDENNFCFVELKHTEKRTSWKRHRKKAQEQLESTINDFKSVAITDNKQLEAYMCCTCKISNKNTKIKNASNQIERITYFEENLDTILYCDNQKEFK